MTQKDRLLQDSDNDSHFYYRLHHTQTLLYDSTRDYLELKYEGRANERIWMAEKDRLLQELDKCKEQLDFSKNDDILHVSEHVLEQRQAQNMEIEVRQGSREVPVKYCFCLVNERSWNDVHIVLTCLYIE